MTDRSLGFPLEYMRLSIVAVVLVLGCNHDPVADGGRTLADLSRPGDGGHENDLSVEVGDMTKREQDLSVPPDLLPPPDFVTLGCVAVAPPFVAFGGVPVGTFSPPQQVKFENICPQQLEILTFGASGPDLSSFVFDGKPTMRLLLNPGGSVMVTVTFGPPGKGAKMAKMYLTPSGFPPAIVPLTGTGL